MPIEARTSGTSNNYFTDETESKFIEWLECEDGVRKEILFNRYLKEPFYAIVDGVMTGYKLFVPNECYEETFTDAVSQLIEKAGKFDKTKGCKAYSYLGTIAKRYLIHRRQKSMDEVKKCLFENTDGKIPDISENDDEQAYEKFEPESFSASLIKSVSSFMKKMCSEADEYGLTQNDVKVGNAIAEIMDNWDSIFHPENRSNKFTKSSVMYSIGEMTMLSRDEIYRSMKKIRNKYYVLKEIILSDDERNIQIQGQG